MTEPWKNGYLQSSALADPLDNPVLQRDSARDLAAALEEQLDQALQLWREHTRGLIGRCVCVGCRMGRVLTGADE